MLERNVGGGKGQARKVYKPPAPTLVRTNHNNTSSSNYNSSNSQNNVNYYRFEPKSNTANQTNYSSINSDKFLSDFKSKDTNSSSTPQTQINNNSQVFDVKKSLLNYNDFCNIFIYQLFIKCLFIRILKFFSISSSHKLYKSE